MTRGESMQRRMAEIVETCAANHGVKGFANLEQLRINPTPRQRARVRTDGQDVVREWSRPFVQDKFGTVTTHGNKLQERIARGVGNPCLLLLIGIPASVVYQERLS